MSLFGDIVDAAESGLSEVGDAVEGVIDGANDTVQGTVDSWIDTVQGWIHTGTEWISVHSPGWIGYTVGVLGGILDGLLQGWQDLLDDSFDIIRYTGNLIGDLLRLDFSAFTRDLAGLGLVLVDLFIDTLRFIDLGYIVGGVVAYFERDALRKFVEGLLKEQFSGDELSRIRSKLGMESGNWGLHYSAMHLRFSLDSKDTELWKWHNDGVLDLYSLAGLLSTDSFEVNKPRTEVKVVGDDGSDNFIAVNRYVISKYIESKGKDYRIRVYSIEPESLAPLLAVASDKCRKLGIKLSWNDQTKYPEFDHYSNHQIFTTEEFLFDRHKNGDDTVGLYIADKELKIFGFNNTLLALCAFYFKEGMGQTGGRDISEPPNLKKCTSHNRTDSCCSMIDTRKNIGSGVMYHDKWPEYIFKYVLAHECGHYFGLCHYGHDGIQNIMFSLEFNSLLDWGFFQYYYKSEPEFTLEDGKNSWRFIVDQFKPYLLE